MVHDGLTADQLTEARCLFRRRASALLYMTAGPAATPTAGPAAFAHTNAAHCDAERPEQREAHEGGGDTEITLGIGDGRPQEPAAEPQAEDGRQNQARQGAAVPPAAQEDHQPEPGEDGDPYRPVREPRTVRTLAPDTRPARPGVAPLRGRRTAIAGQTRDGGMDQAWAPIRLLPGVTRRIGRGTARRVRAIRAGFPGHVPRVVLFEELVLEGRALRDDGQLGPRRVRR